MNKNTAMCILPIHRMRNRESEYHKRLAIYWFAYAVSSLFHEIFSKVAYILSLHK